MPELRPPPPGDPMEELQGDLWVQGQAQHLGDVESGEGRRQLVQRSVFLPFPAAAAAANTGAGENGEHGGGGVGVEREGSGEGGEGGGRRDEGGEEVLVE